MIFRKQSLSILAMSFIISLVGLLYFQGTWFYSQAQPPITSQSTSLSSPSDLAIKDTITADQNTLIQTLSLTDGLIAYYPFNGNADDASGNSHHGTVNGAILTTDRFGQANSAYYFDGQDDNINIPDHADLDIVDEVTLSAWVQADSVGGGEGVVSKVKTNGRGPWELAIGQGTLSFYFRGSSSYRNPLYTLYHDESPVIDRWYHLVGTGKDGVAKLYVDGTEVMTQTYAGQFWSNDYDVYIGTRWQHQDIHFFHGTIDEVRIYNRALSAKEVDLLYDPRPQIDVQGNGQSINNGDKTPSLIDATDFGTTSVGTPITRTFTISNCGSLPLTLMSPVTVPNGFSAGSFSTTQIPPDSTTTVDIQLDATTSGTFTGSVQIAHNDPDESLYTFVIQGLVNAPNSILYSVYLPVVLSDYTPPATFPIHIGDTIPRRGVAESGQVFYRKAVEVPANLPADGHFYLSSKSDTVVETLVDDKVVILLGGVEVLTYNFSANGSPEAAVVEVPRATMEQMAGKSVVVEYRDMYGHVVEARAMWLIWSPS